MVGSTEFILNAIKNAEAGTTWLVGTELNLVNRLANEMIKEDKIVKFMSHIVCECTTMARIDPQHLSWVLDNLLEGKVVNEIVVPPSIAQSAKVALDRMMAIV
jgi:quinolinate synthase